MGETVNVDFEEVEVEETLREKAKAKLDRVIEFCKNNQQLICVMGPAVIGSCIELMKIIARRSSVNEQRRLKENYIYDRSNGHYYELRRPLKSSEWLQIDERKLQGQPLGEILRDMRVLK